MMEKKDFDMCEVLCTHPQAIRMAKAQMISAEQTQQVAELFKIFGDPTRVKILQVLAKREMCVCDIVSVIEMGQSAVSHQLRIMRNARIVKYRRDGKNAWYSLSDQHIAALLYQGIEHIQHS